MGIDYLDIYDKIHCNKFHKWIFVWLQFNVDVWMKF